MRAGRAVSDTKPDRLAKLHEHYASNARARGHREDCATVTGAGGRVWDGVPVNWPTIFGQPACTCGAGR